jgi:hypothetical protein
MHVFILNECGSQGHHTAGVSSDLPKVFHNRKNAEMELHRLNSERDGSYELREVEVADDEEAPLDSMRLCGELTDVMAQASARAMFVACCRLLFEAHADLQSFHWVQCYLPCDDCEETTLWTSAATPGINGHNGKDLHGQESSEATLQRIVARFLAPVSHDLLPFLFGAESIVTINRDGEVTVEDVLTS